MISLCACTPSLEVDTIEVGVVRALCIDEREREYSQLRLISYCNSGIVPSQHYFLLSLQSRHLSFVHAVNRKSLNIVSQLMERTLFIPIAVECSFCSRRDCCRANSHGTCNCHWYVGSYIRIIGSLSLSEQFDRVNNLLWSSSMGSQRR